MTTQTKKLISNLKKEIEELEKRERKSLKFNYKKLDKEKNDFYTCCFCGKGINLRTDLYYSLKNPKNIAETMYKDILCFECVDLAMTERDKEFSDPDWRGYNWGIDQTKAQLQFAEKLIEAIKGDIERTNINLEELKQGDKKLSKKQIIEGASILIIFKEKLNKILDEAK